MKNTYTGTCHCGAIEYEVEADLSETTECNCSYCAKKGMRLTFVDKDAFTLKKGEGNLSSYKFNKEVIDHVFCKTCGIQSFAKNDAYPKMAINVRCLDGVDVDTLPPPKKIDGR